MTLDAGELNKAQLLNWKLKVGLLIRFYWMLSEQTAFLLGDCGVKYCESFYTELRADVLLSIMLCFVLFQYGRMAN